MERILILGAYGRLGTKLRSKISNSKYELFFQGRGECAQIRVDPVEPAEIYPVLAEIKPDIIINLAAQTDVKLCEKNPKDAFLVNAQIVRTVENFISRGNGKAKSTFLLQISTDQVYCSPFPNTEDQALPINIYGMTKMLGEQAALGCGGAVLRTNYIGKSFNQKYPSLTDWIVRSLRAKTNIKGFDNVFINALHSSTLCHLIELVISARRPGLFNVGTSSFYSKSDIIRHLGMELKLDTSMVEFCPASFPDNSPRPLNMSMNVSKFERQFGFKLPSYTSELEKVSAEYV